MTSREPATPDTQTPTQPVIFPPVTPPRDSTRDDVRLAWTRARQAEERSPLKLMQRDALGSVALWLAGCLDLSSSSNSASAGVRSLGLVRHIVIASDHAVATEHPELSFVCAGQDDLDASVRDTAEDLGVESIWYDATALAPHASPADRGDALTESEYTAALQGGVDLADAQADAGVTVVLLGDHGRGLTSTAAALVGTVCSVEPVRIVGRGSGIDDLAWRTKVGYIRDAMYRVRDDRSSAERVLRRAGSPDIVAMAGFLGQCAVRRTPVIFDGAGATAAALLAHMLVPGASAWWSAASAGTEPSAREALTHLELSPILDLSIDTDQGVCALLALPLVRHAWRTVPAL